MNVRRAGAWLVLLVLAAAQAWAARFYATPDGVSYMDLSDAVLHGDWGELLNAYWSPAYPVLLGALRALLTDSAYWEFAVAHLLNFLCFAASLAAFEYFVAAVRRLGRERWDKPGLSTPWGMVGAYAVFGAFTLTMTPLVLPTPDLLVSTASLLAFGALLRLRYDMDVRRSAVVLGVALAVGSLTKSFVIPWAGVCLVTAALALRGRSLRPAAVAAAIWMAAVLPWTAGLTARYGHLTFGDTGRLTYVWYVNQVESPSRQQMPHAAATPATDSLLRGVAVTANASGTNPIWYDPSRWYTDLRPRFELSRQVEVFSRLAAEYIASLAPVFLVLAFWLIVSGRRGVTEWWTRTWPVALPSFAALAAYSLVLVTTRYVAPFYVALTLVVLCGARWPERISPTRMLLAIAVPLIAMVATPNPGRPLALINAAVGSVLFVWIARHRAASVRVVLAVLGGLVVYLLQPFSDLRYVAMMSVLLILAYWAIARSAEGRNEEGMVSHMTRRALLTANAVIVLGVAALKYADSLDQVVRNPDEPNDSWNAAQVAGQAGIGAGTRVALVGSPFDAYWARAGRSQLVAVVPRPRIADFNALTPEQRGRLYAEFAKAGAEVLVVQQADPTPEMDASWRPVPGLGWVKPLAP